MHSQPLNMPAYPRGISKSYAQRLQQMTPEQRSEWLYGKFTE